MRGFPICPCGTSQIGNFPLKGGYHDDYGEKSYVVSTRPARQFRDVTSGDVLKRSELAKHLSRRTVVKLTAAYIRLVTDS